MKYTLILLIYFTLGYDSFGNNLGLITKYSQVNEIESSDSIQFKGLKRSYCGAEKISFSLEFTKKIPPSSKLKIFLTENSGIWRSGKYDELWSPLFKGFVDLEDRNRIYEFSNEFREMPCYISIVNEKNEVIAKTHDIISNGPQEFQIWSYNPLPRECNDKPFQLYSNEYDRDYLLYLYGKINPAKLTWQLNGLDIPNATARSLSAQVSGEYSAKLEFDNCILQSNKIKLELLNLGLDKPEFLLKRQNPGSLCHDDEDGLLTLDTSSNRAKYDKVEWLFNSQPFEGNKVSVNASKTGYYQCVGYKNNCSQKSDSVFLSFEAYMVNQIGVISNYSAKLESNTISICKGDFVNIFSKVLQTDYSFDNNSPNLLSAFKENYEGQWQKNGIDISSATNYFLKTNEEGTYRLKLKQKDCISYSNEIVVKQNQEFKSKLSFSPIDYENQKKIQVFENELVLISPKSSNYNLDKWTKQLYRNNQVINDERVGSNYYYKFKESGLYQLKYIEPNGSGCFWVSDPFEVETIKKEKVFKTDTLLLCQNLTLFMPLYTANLYLGYKKPQYTNVHKWYIDEKLIGEESTLIIDKPGMYKYVGYNEFDEKMIKSYYVTERWAIKLYENIFPVNNNNFEICNGQVLKLELGEPLKYSKIDIYKDGLLYRKDMNSILLNQPGEYFIKKQINNCIVESSKFNLKIKPPLQMAVSPKSDSVFICKGGIEWLQNSVGANQKNNWYRDNELISSNQSLLRVNSTGIYQLTTESGNCIESSKKIIVAEANIIPSAKISGDSLLSFNANTKLKLNFTSSPPFLFTINNSITGYSEKKYFEVPIQAVENKEYKITYLSNSCGEGEFSGTAKISVLVLGSNPENDAVLKIFPNPSAEVCTVSLENADQENVKLKLINSKGQIIWTKDYGNINKINDQIDFRDIASGIYQINLNIGKKTISRKVMKN